LACSSILVSKKVSKMVRWSYAMPYLDLTRYSAAGW